MNLFGTIRSLFGPVRVTGKVILVDEIEKWSRGSLYNSKDSLMATGRTNAVVPDLSLFWAEVPVERRANSLEDASTLVKLSWRSEDVGHYQGSSGGLACKVACSVSIIEASTGKVLSTKDFVGGPPPPSIVRRHGDLSYPVHGEHPIEPVRDYLRRLMAP
jgi:hypothetical protein